MSSYQSWVVLWVCTSDESRIIFLPERSGIRQHRLEIPTMQARVSLLLAHPVMYILKTQQCIVHFENNQQALLATYDKLHYWDL